MSPEGTAVIRIRANPGLAIAWVRITSILGFVIGWDRAQRIMDVGYGLVLVKVDGDRWRFLPRALVERNSADT